MSFAEMAETFGEGDVHWGVTQEFYVACVESEIPIGRLHGHAA